MSPTCTSERPRSIREIEELSKEVQRAFGDGLVRAALGVLCHQRMSAEVQASKLEMMARGQGSSRGRRSLKLSIKLLRTF